MKISQLTCGLDPECMLFDNKQQKIVSAIPVLKRGKTNKINLGEGVLMYYDNTMVEFNVNPSNSKDEFLHNINAIFQKSSKHFKNKYQIQLIASHNFTKKECDHEEAKVAGCDPEFDAYEAISCTPPQFEGGFRSAGGHIHLGRSDYKNFYNFETSEELQNNWPYLAKDNVEGEVLLDPYSKLNVIKLMDIFVGIPLILFEKNDKTNLPRKKLYGKAARHRPSAFGCEYRVPSNYWLRSRGLSELIYDLAAKAVQTEIDKESQNVFDLFNQEDIILTINEGLHKKAQELLKKIPLDNSLRAKVNEYASRQLAPQGDWS